MAASAVILNIIIIMNIYYWFDVNKGAILNSRQYGGKRGKFKLCYYFEALLW